MAVTVEGFLARYKAFSSIQDQTVIQAALDEATTLHSSAAFGAVYDYVCYLYAAACLTDEPNITSSGPRASSDQERNKYWVRYDTHAKNLCLRRAHVSGGLDE